MSCGSPGIMEAILEMGPLAESQQRAVGNVDWEGDVHVHNVLDLLTPVTNAQLALFELFGHLLLFVWVLRRNVLHVFHEALDIAQSKQLGNEWLRCKLVEVM